ncbi:MAG: hypothetical protein AB7F50_09740 [Fimbriimonadaceae bacterium]
MFAAVLAVYVLLVHPVDTTTAALLARRDSLHGRSVVVRGVVVDYRPRVSKAGNKYTTFSLAAGGAKVSVYHRGHMEPALQDGDAVTVTGVFEKERKVGNFTVHDQVDATELKGRPYGVRK